MINDVLKLLLRKNISRTSYEWNDDWLLLRNYSQLKIDRKQNKCIFEYNVIIIKRKVYPERQKQVSYL